MVLILSQTTRGVPLDHVAVDLTEANGRTQPEIGLLPIVHGSAYPVEAVAECNVIAHGDVEVVNFIAYRTLERRERLFPTFPVCICSPVLQRGHDVERHEFPRVDGHNPIDVPRPKRLDPTLYYPFDFGFIVFLVFFDCHSFLLSRACYEPQVLVVISPRITNDQETCRFLAEKKSRDAWGTHWSVTQDSTIRIMSIWTEKA